MFLRYLTATGSVAVAGIVSSYFWMSEKTVHAKCVRRKETSVLRPNRHLPMREEQVESLKEGVIYDVLIIGGGATGAGCALDACTRGLRTCLIERDDFASGTSSRSTKLVHGGVRYLQKAIMELDYEQFKMVREALHERAFMLQNAPHLTRPIQIMLPVYTWWQLPYYWSGIKMYDLIAVGKTLKSSYLLSKSNALEKFPMLKGDKLKGAIVYYDGQLDDARMNLAVALSASRHGATVVNHVEVIDLIKDTDELGNTVLKGVKVRDELTWNEWEVKAKCIINATGPFTDSIRKMDDPNVPEICSPSSGTHIVLPGYYSPSQMGLLDPDTSDGRVIFFLPWQKHTIAGTTDRSCELTSTPRPTEAEIMFILDEIKNYLNPDIEVRKGDVLSAWSGIRPLVSDPNKQDTQSVVRNHLVHISPSKLITIAGGKWTTYRSMAEQTIDAAIKACDLKPERCCQTSNLLLEGAHDWSPTMYIRLVQDFGLECEVAQHLANSYGDRAFAVTKMALPTHKRWPIIGNKIHPEFPYIDAEVLYGCREYARTAVDMIARRLRLAFLNVQAAQEVLPRVIDLMAEELKWSPEEKNKQHQQANDFLAYQMGNIVSHQPSDNVPINLTKEEILLHIKWFKSLDKDRKGYVSITDIHKALKTSGERRIHGPKLHEVIKEIDANRNGQVELMEYLQMISAINTGCNVTSHFKPPESEESKVEKLMIKKQISVERSCGGV